MAVSLPSPQPKTPDVMTVAEFAELTGRSRRNVYQLAKEQRLPFPVLRIGRSVLFPRAAVEAWFAGERTAR